MATAIIPEPQGKIEQRRLMLLDAAENVFLKKGFEGATMQDVASAANMSPGNIYRYFPSKSLIIAGLVERDRADMAEKFALLADAENKFEAFEAIGRGYFRNEACPKSPLTLEIWASASRSAEIMATCQGIENAVRDHIMAFLVAARANGEIADDIDLDLVRDLILLLADGVMRLSAMFGEAEIDRSIDLMFATIRAAAAGHIRLPYPAMTRAS
jgi:TetR/AcrR family transcriptional regulator, repressor for uid operon